MKNTCPATTHTPMAASVPGICATASKPAHGRASAASRPQATWLRMDIWNGSRLYTHSRLASVNEMACSQAAARVSST